MTTTATYTTTLKFAQYLQIQNYAPIVDNPTKGAGTAFETVGTASGGGNYFLDNKSIINGTLRIWTGGTTASAVELTDGTHFTKDLDRGIITINATGSAVANGSALYAEYQHYSHETGMNDTLALDAIRRAQNHIEEETDAVWVEGNTATPAWPMKWQELHKGRGQFDRTYLTEKYPIQIIVARLNSQIGTAVTTITADSTNGFLSSGTCVINTEQFSYTGKTTTEFTGVTRGVNGTTASAHSAAAIITNHIVEMSLDAAGTTATWETQEYLVDYGIDPVAGSIKLVNFDSIASTILQNKYPVQDLPDRLRITYPYGYNTIPEEIERLTLMIAAKELRSRTINRALIAGRDEFKPSMVNVDDTWIQNTLDRHTSYRSSRPT